MSRRESGYGEYPGGQVPVSVQYVPQTHVSASVPPSSLRQSFGAPVYRDTSPYRNPVRSDDTDIQRIQEELRFSRQEEMRLAAMVAAKESVVQKNADAIKVFRDAMAERDQEMKRILIEEETQLKNLVAEYKLRFERERERLLEALRECGRCTKLISEILPTCVESQRLASEILSGKPTVDAVTINAVKTQPSDAHINRSPQAQARTGEENVWDMTSFRPGSSTVQLKVSGPAPTQDRAELEESLL